MGGRRFWKENQVYQESSPPLEVGTSAWPCWCAEKDGGDMASPHAPQWNQGPGPAPGQVASLRPRLRSCGCAGEIRHLGGRGSGGRPGETGAGNVPVTSLFLKVSTMHCL